MLSKVQSEERDEMTTPRMKRISDDEVALSRLQELRHKVVYREVRLRGGLDDKTGVDASTISLACRNPENCTVNTYTRLAMSLGWPSYVPGRKIIRKPEQKTIDFPAETPKPPISGTKPAAQVSGDDLMRQYERAHRYDLKHILSMQMIEKLETIARTLHREFSEVVNHALNEYVRKCEPILSYAVNEEGESE